MAKRKVDFENRAFQSRWETEYMFIDFGGKPVCLICGDKVAVIKEYNLRRHFETKHKGKLANLDVEQKSQMVEELKRNLSPHQTSRASTNSHTDAAVKASYLVAEEIVKSARPFSEGELVQRCMIKVCEALCPDQQGMFAKVSLSSDTVTQRVCELARDVKAQLAQKCKDFVAYSLAVDEVSYTPGIALLAVCVRGVDSSLKVTEEILDVTSMQGTATGQEIFDFVCHSVSDMSLSWDKLVGLATNGAPAMCGDHGLVGRMRSKVKESCAGELVAYHCILHQGLLSGKVLDMGHVLTNVAQTIDFLRAKGLNLSQFQSFLQGIESEFGDLPFHTEMGLPGQGIILNRVFWLMEEICGFMESKGQECRIVWEDKLKCELAFLADMASHLNILALQLQGWDHVISDMHDAVRAFQVKLSLWHTQMAQCNMSHFPCCHTMLSQVSPEVFPSAHFAEKLSSLSREFAQRFSDIQAQKSNLDLFRNPFAVNVETAPVHLQMELIEVQCNGTLKAKYDQVGPTQFPAFIPKAMPQLRVHAARTLSLFGNTCLCEQLVSVVKTNQTSHYRSPLTEEHLRSILRVAIAKNLAPNLDELVARERCQTSSSDQ